MTKTKLPKYVYLYTEQEISLMNSQDKEFQGITSPGYYFVDETECFMHGPFSTVNETEKALECYAKSL